MARGTHTPITVIWLLLPDVLYLTFLCPLPVTIFGAPWLEFQFRQHCKCDLETPSDCSQPVCASASQNICRLCP